MRVAVYPGSFDPITTATSTSSRRAAAVFDRLVVAVLDQSPQDAAARPSPSGSTSIRASVAAIDPAARRADRRRVLRRPDGRPLPARRGAGFIVRGLRAISDFETEMQLAHNNRVLAPGVDTVFFMTSVEHGYVSSSLVKEIARFGGDVAAMVPAPAEAALRVAP